MRCWGTNGSASLRCSAKNVRSESGGQSIRSGFGNASERYDFAKAKNSSSLISFRSLLRIGSPGCLPRLLLWDRLVNGVRSTGVPMLAPEKLFDTAFFTVGAVIVLLWSGTTPGLRSDHDANDPNVGRLTYPVTHQNQNLLAARWNALSRAFTRAVFLPLPQ